MTRSWQDRLARVRGAVDREIGETLVISRYVQNQYAGPVPDPNTPTITVIGVLEVGEGRDVNLAGGQKTSWKARIPAGEAEAHVDPETYPAIGTAKTGDRVKAADRPGEPEFEISRIDRNRRNRFTLILTVI